MSKLLQDEKVSALVDKHCIKARKEEVSRAVAIVKAAIGTAETKEVKAALKAVLAEIKAA